MPMIKWPESRSFYTRMLLATSSESPGSPCPLTNSALTSVRWASILTTVEEDQGGLSQ